MSSATPAKKSNAKASKAAAAPVASPAAPVVVPPPAPVVAHTAAAHGKQAAAAPVAPVVVAAVPVAAAVEAVEEESVVANFAGLLTKFNALRTALNELAPEMKKMEKQVARLEKKAERRRRRKTGADGEKKANPTTVFTKPVEITKELCVFLQLAPGTQISRSDVTRGVMKYAKEHQLTDKQTIKPDATLRKLLGLTEKDNLTILNLQKYLKGHYVKAVVVPTA
jgi:predicted secreted protein